MTTRQERRQAVGIGKLENRGLEKYVEARRSLSPSHLPIALYTAILYPSTHQSGSKWLREISMVSSCIWSLER